MKKAIGRLAVAAFILTSGTFSAQAVPRLGQAIIVALDGHADYVDPEKNTERLDLGTALFHGHAIKTSDNGSLRSMLTPGAMLCIAPNSMVHIDQLEILTEGLPGSQKPVNRKIVLGFEQGAMRLHLGEDAQNITATVKTVVGEFTSSRGQFILLRSRNAIQGFCERGTVTLTTLNGETVELTDNEMLTAVLNSGGLVSVDKEGETLSHPYYSQFSACRESSYMLEPYFVHVPFVGSEGIFAAMSQPVTELVYVGEPRRWFDVSPTVRPFSDEIRQQNSVRGAPDDGAEKGQWDRQRAWEWYRMVGTIRGVNYLPRTCVNATDMWQAAGFDKDIIDEELGWAADSGFNAIRVFLPYIVWADDPAGLKYRMKEFLKIADAHDLMTAFVLFDDYRPAGKDAYLGEQDEPRQGVRFSAWTPSPGHAMVADKSAWSGLKNYVQDIVGTFKDDERILFWDVYNTAGRSGMLNRSIPLVQQAFNWARDVNPSQPLTSALWSEIENQPAKRLIDMSDIVTFQSFEGPVTMEDRLLLSKIAGRPVMCVEWLSRTRESTFDNVLPVFAYHGVGWFNWGLVRGKVQSFLPWDAAPGATEPELWEQDILKEDGTPYDEDEIDMIKGFSFDGI